MTRFALVALYSICVMNRDSSKMEDVYGGADKVAEMCSSTVSLIQVPDAINTDLNTTYVFS